MLKWVQCGLSTGTGFEIFSGIIQLKVITKEKFRCFRVCFSLFGLLKQNTAVDFKSESDKVGSFVSAFPLILL